jgi:uncharacterized protein
MDSSSRRRPEASRVLAAIAGDPMRMELLEAVRSLALPDCAIGAGFVRNRVWDVAHGNAETPLADVDVLFHDPSDVSREREELLEQELGRLANAPWSVKNQARMHLRNGDRPYRSTEDAISFWLETPTCVAVKLSAAGELELIAPYGVDDLVTMIVRPTPRGREKPEAYRDRVRAKQWQRTWPKLVLLDPDDC